jgi:hypothetical protein
LISFFLPEPREPYTEFYRLKSSSREIWDEIFFHNMENIYISFWSLYNELNKTGVCQNMSFEKIISNALLNLASSYHQTFAGTGFATMTSCVNIPNIDSEENGIVLEIKIVIEILDKASHYLEELVKSHKPSSITL